jgi:tRNA pseudouridine55 synthase
VIDIYELDLIEVTPLHLDLDVHCSKGTYIRSLAEDIGEAFGCGGHVERLRRMAVGNFSIAQAVGFEQLVALSDEQRLKSLLPLERIVAELPAVSLGEELAFFLRHGQPVLVPKAPRQGLLRLYSRQDAFLGIGEVLEDGRIAPRRLVRETAVRQSGASIALPGS